MTHSVEDSEFAIHNRKEIVFVLEGLAKQRTAINLDAADGTGFVTSVLAVSADANQIYLDISADEKLNQKVLRAGHVFFVTQTGVKVRWYAAHLEMVELSDGDAFAISMPLAVERVQRREYFRLNTPQGSKALVCKIPVGEESFIEINVVDMSVGGIGLSIKGTPHAVFSQGALLEGCSIVFPVVGVVPMQLRICGIWATIQTRSGEQMHHIGLKFEKLSRGAENVVQRYMAQLEAEKISLT